VTEPWTLTRRLELDDFWKALVECHHDLPALLRLIADRVVDLVGDGCVLTTLSPDGTMLRPRVVVHSDLRVAAEMSAALGAGGVPLGEGIAGTVAAERRAVVLNDLSPETVAETTPERYDAFVRAHPIRGLIIVPLVAAGELVGTLGAVRTESDEPYTEQDLHLLEALAERAALAVADALEGPRAVGDADFEAIYRYSPDGIILSTPDGHILAANPAACDILGTTERAIIDNGRQGLLAPNDPKVNQGLAERARSGRVRGEIQMRRGDGSVFTAEVSSSVFTSPSAKVRTVVIFRDVSKDAANRAALRARLTELEQVIHRDPLTRLWNREGFTIAAEQALATADRQGVVAQLIFVDVDQLKAINDRGGHSAGDAALVAVARAIEQATREMDVACRLGGDEFVLLVVDVPTTEVAGVIERIERALAPDTIAALPVTISTGVTERAPGDDVPLDELIDVADRVMYQHKLLSRLRRRSDS
jgi:diguanylate cyclase (GGDEF)-like protein/PAS domain S-box-containing protein